MILNDEQITAQNLVKDPVARGARASTYDATVGEIISEGEIVDENSFTLPKRGIVWVISHEQFTLPPNITGLATLRTTWTHNGILALNLGIIDPGWKGHLATALVNFGNGKFKVSKGEPFFRIMFHEHAPSQVPPKSSPPERQYMEDILSKSRLFSQTFLGMDSLVQEVSEQVLSFPKWAVGIGIVSLLLALLAIYAPIAYTVGEEFFNTRNSNSQRIDQLEKSVKELQANQPMHSSKEPASPDLPKSEPTQ